MSMNIDAHSHLYDSIKLITEEESKFCIESLQFKKIILMSTIESDWRSLASLVEKLRHQCHSCELICAFGIHPWKIQRNQAIYSINYVDELMVILQKHLLSDTTSLVGEMGLDRFERILKTGEGSICSETDIQIMRFALGSHFETLDEQVLVQMYVFHRQFELACQLRRPVSLHAVKSDSLYFSYFSKRLKKGSSLPPSILLHSYSGSKETLDRYIKLFEGSVSHLFVSFSRVIHERLPEAKRDRLMQAVGKDAILLETDMASSEGMRDNMNWIFCIYSNLFFKGSHKEADLQLTSNFSRYMSPSPTLN